MQADFILDYDVLTAGSSQRLHLMARFISGSTSQDRRRRPVNLSLVIDRSGSMGGDKIDYTRQAAQFLVQNLSVRDTLSIVLYNDSVETLLMPEKVQRKDVINQRIAAIKPKGTTNLSAGWLEGCNLVTKNLDDGHVNRVILMSDGLANRGVTSTEQLVRLVQQKRKEGISTTTMGLGTDFNEDLLMEMANAGGGAYYFIESPEVAPAIFDEELRGLLNIIGQNLTITVEPGEHIQVDSQLNAYPMSTDGRQVTFRLGDIFGDEVKALVVQMTVPAIREIGRKQIALLRFEYDELNDGGAKHQVIEVPVVVNVQSADSIQQPSLENPEVKQSVLLLQAAQARKRAIKAADQGEFETAAESLRSAAEAIEAAQTHDPRLLEEQSALIQQATELEQGAARYGQYSRKTMSTQAFYTMTSRHDDTVMLRIREQQRQGEIPEPPIKNPPTSEQPAVPREEIQIERREGIPPTVATWKEQSFPLKGDLIRIGRSKHNEIIILAAGVSRFHCQIRRIGDHLVLEDLGSTNGTMLHGQVLDKPHVLSVGDVAYLCDEKLVFHDGTFG